MPKCAFNNSRRGAAPSDSARLPPSCAVLTPATDADRRPTGSAFRSAGLALRGRSGPCRRGAAALEFALALPFYLVVAMGIIDYSTAIVHKQHLLNAAREGALAGTEQTTTAKVKSTSNARMREVLDGAGTCDFGNCSPTTDVILVGGSPSFRVVRAKAKLRSYRGVTRFVPVPNEISAEYTVLWEKQP